MATQTGTVGEPTPTRLKDYRACDFGIATVDLDFQLHETATTVKAEITLFRNKSVKDPVDLVLDGVGLELVSVHLQSPATENGQKVVADAKEVKGAGGATQLVFPAKSLPAEAENKFKVFTEVKINPTSNTELMGLYLTGPMLCTQCEAQGFRRITYFLDRPDVLTTYRVRLEAEKSKFPVLLSNGNKVEAGDVADGRHFVVYEDPSKKPSYLFAVVAGDLVNVTGTHVRPDGRPVDLAVWCEPFDKPKLGFALECLKKAMKWDEENFGRIYDLDLYNVVATHFFNMGAMENKSLNIFNATSLLANAESATDLKFIRIAHVVGHEYFHNWTGNRVTVRDWFQVTLKEGLTNYRENRFAEDLFGEANERIAALLALTSRQFAEDAGPMAHPVRPEEYLDIDNFYTATVYSKGSEVIRMYQTLLGVDGFRKGMDLYFERHDGSAVTCEDFLAAMADANQRDLSQFMLWYSQVGTPEVEVLKSEYDAEKHQYVLKLKQSVPPPRNPKYKALGKPLLIPVSVGLIGKSSGKDLVGTKVLELKEFEQEFILEGVEEDSYLSLFRGFSAPVRAIREVSLEELNAMVKHETDPVNRWTCMQEIMTKLVLEWTAAKSKDSSYVFPEVPASMIDVFRAVLLADMEDKRFQASLLAPPKKSVLFQKIQKCKPAVLAAAVDHLVTCLLQEFQDDFLRIFEEISESLKGKEYQAVKEDIGRRQLKSLCLAYLAFKPTPEAISLVKKAFHDANNMTDRLAALGFICKMVCPERDELLKIFYENFAKGDTLIVQEWFRAQSLSDAPDCRERLTALLEHPDFNVKNPNVVRSIFWGFQGSFNSFHDPSGAGYEFFASHVIAMDKINGKAAATSAKYLLIHDLVDDCYAALIMKQLRRIADTPDLSASTREVIASAVSQA